MITIDALRICDGERTLLDGVTMHLPANAVHGIAGEGRSALLQALYGLVVPDAGRITLGGHPLRRCDVAYLEAEPRFWPVSCVQGIVCDAQNRQKRKKPCAAFDTQHRAKVDIELLK